jgi:hypothetical protein
MRRTSGTRSKRRPEVPLVPAPGVVSGAGIDRLTLEAALSNVGRAALQTATTLETQLAGLPTTKLWT